MDDEDKTKTEIIPFPEKKKPTKEDVLNLIFENITFDSFLFTTTLMNRDIFSDKPKTPKIEVAPENQGVYSTVENGRTVVHITGERPILRTASGDIDLEWLATFVASMKDDVE